MDRQMKQVTKKIVTAEHVLREAEKQNKKLTHIDKTVRDPLIEKYKKIKK